MPHIHFCGARVFFYCAGGSLWLYLKFWALDFDKRESFLISLKDETERRSNSRRIKSEASKWARQHFRCTSGLFNNFSHTDGYCICNSSSPEEKREPRTMRGERGRRESSCCVNVVVVGLFLYFSTYRTAPQSVPYPSKNCHSAYVLLSLFNWTKLIDFYDWPQAHWSKLHFLSWNPETRRVRFSKYSVWSYYTLTSFLQGKNRVQTSNSQVKYRPQFRNQNLECFECSWDTLAFASVLTCSVLSAVLPLGQLVVTGADWAGEARANQNSQKSVLKVQNWKTNRWSFILR